MTNIKERLFAFSVNIIKLVESLPKTTAGYAVGNQIIRSGTAVGAIIEEASGSLSYNDFVNLLRQARKEAKETLYWLKLIAKSGLLKETATQLLAKECDEIIRILSQSIKTSETRQDNHKITRKKS